MTIFQIRNIIQNLHIVPPCNPGSDGPASFWADNIRLKPVVEEKKKCEEYNLRARESIQDSNFRSNKLSNQIIVLKKEIFKIVK